MRRRQADKRITIPDPLYEDALVAKFIDSVMSDGKKSVAQRLVYGAFDMIEERTGEEGVEVFRKAVNNVAPLVEVRSRRVGGATYQVPIEVRAERRTSLAFRWLLQYARSRGDKSMAQRLAARSRRPQGRRRCRQEEGRHAPHGRSQQGLRPLPILSRRHAVAPSGDH